MQQLIVDSDGKLYQATAQFPFVDPTTGVRFEPGMQVRVKPNAWIDSQPTIVLVEEAAPAKKAEAPAKAPTKEAEAKA